MSPTTRTMSVNQVKGEEDNVAAADAAIEIALQKLNSKQRVIQDFAFGRGGILVSDEAADAVARNLTYALSKRAPSRLINILLLDILGVSTILNSYPDTCASMKDTIRIIQDIMMELLGTEVDVLRPLYNLRIALRRNHRAADKYFATLQASSSSAAARAPLESKDSNMLTADPNKESKSRIKTRRPLKTAVTIVASGSNLEQQKSGVVGVRSSTRIKRQTYKKACSYYPAKRKVSTPITKSETTPVKSNSNSDANCEARKIRTNFANFISRRSLEFDCQILSTELTNESEPSEWQDIDDASLLEIINADFEFFAKFVEDSLNQILQEEALSANATANLE